MTHSVLHRIFFSIFWYLGLLMKHHKINAAIIRAQTLNFGSPLYTGQTSSLLRPLFVESSWNVMAHGDARNKYKMSKRTVRFYTPVYIHCGQQ
jgi:hypothetical protein